MKVIKPPTKVVTKEETCKSCGAVLELNSWDTITRKWYICPCCHAVNVVETIVDGVKCKQ